MYLLNYFFHVIPRKLHIPCKDYWLCRDWSITISCHLGICGELALMPSYALGLYTSFCVLFFTPVKGWSSGEVTVETRSNFHIQTGIIGNHEPRGDNKPKRKATICCYHFACGALGLYLPSCRRWTPTKFVECRAAADVFVTDSSGYVNFLGWTI